MPAPSCLASFFFCSNFWRISPTYFCRLSRLAYDNNNNYNNTFLLRVALNILLIYTWPTEKENKKQKSIKKTMIHRREFEDKLTKELIKIVHYHLKTSICLCMKQNNGKRSKNFTYLFPVYT